MDIKTIGDLKDLRFFVPAYQRGYRWTENEVEALLDDIYEFSTEGQKKMIPLKLSMVSKG